MIATTEPPRAALFSESQLHSSQLPRLRCGLLDAIPSVAACGGRQARMDDFDIAPTKQIDGSAASAAIGELGMSVATRACHRDLVIEARTT